MSCIINLLTEIFKRLNLNHKIEVPIFYKIQSQDLAKNEVLKILVSTMEFLFSSVKWTEFSIKLFSFLRV